MSVFVYNVNYECYFYSPYAITQTSCINSGKRPFLEQELKFLITQARLIAGVQICYFVDNAEAALHEILINYYEHPELHKIWIRFYGFQRDYLTLYTPKNHQIADDIYDCFNMPWSHQPGKYIQSYAPKESEVLPNSIQEEPEVESTPILPNSIQEEPEVESTPEIKQPRFDWISFGESLDDVARHQFHGGVRYTPKQEKTTNINPKANASSNPKCRHRGGKRNGGCGPRK